VRSEANPLRPRMGGTFSSMRECCAIRLSALICCDEMFTVLAPGTRSGGKGGPAAKGGASKQTAAGVSIRQLEDEDSDAPMKLQTVSMDLRLALAQARAAKGLSQKDFAQKLNIPATVIQDYESGKAIPNNGLIAKMERALGAKLPRNK
jgi:ribosome-binding protein aMBF1 (putative translation factor)